MHNKVLHGVRNLSRILRDIPGLFSFKNYQSMSVTESLFRRSGRVCKTRIGVNLRTNSLQMVGGNSDSRLHKGRDSEIAPTKDIFQTYLTAKLTLMGRVCETRHVISCRVSQTLPDLQIVYRNVKKYWRKTEN